MTAAALWEHVHQAGQGHRRIVADRPSLVREADTTTPVVFDIEDPWGKYQYEPRQEQWLDRLPQLLRTASANRKFIITTREDVMMDAGVRNSIKRWMISLQPDDYSRAQRRRMYDDRIPSAPRALQISLARVHDRVLNELSTPNEIDRFFANLHDPDEPGIPAAEQIAAARDKARHDFIELTIAQQVRGRHEQLWAVIVWALLGARKKLTRQAFVDIHGSSRNWTPLSTPAWIGFSTSLSRVALCGNRASLSPTITLEQRRRLLRSQPRSRFSLPSEWRGSWMHSPRWTLKAGGVQRRQPPCWRSSRDLRCWKCNPAHRHRQGSMAGSATNWQRRRGKIFVRHCELLLPLVRRTVIPPSSPALCWKSSRLLCSLVAVSDANESNLTRDGSRQCTQTHQFVRCVENGWKLHCQARASTT